MTDQELIKQWDEYVESMGSVMGEVEHMAQQMADRIEVLVRQRDGWEETALMYAQNVDFWKSKLAKAVEALMQLQLIVGDILGAHLQDSESRDKAIDLIKTTLAELKEEE